VRLTLVRNATLLVELAGRRILVEPMLDDVGARPPVEDSPNPRRNPLVPLPLPAEEVVRDLDAVLITHLHQDHFDETGARLVPRDVPVFCQP
jgi:L-ascorbate metabolism protein UlaG (beta-lactamase superfamily)